MSVSRINSTNISQTGRINNSTTTHTPSISHYQFRDRIDWIEQELKQQIPETDNTTEQIATLLSEVLFDVVNRGCAIVSRGALLAKGQNSVIEATFKPPHKQKQPPEMHIPLGLHGFRLEAINHVIPNAHQEGRRHVEGLVQQIVQQQNNQSLIKLLILIAHEYGHLISYQRGNHDAELKIGLSQTFSQTFSNNKNLASNFAYVVFNEEVTAWRIAEQRLKRTSFPFWDNLNQLKYASLKAYFKQLNLKNSDVATYCKLSMLGLELGVLSPLADESRNPVR